jgi:DNA-binding LacI/PurR family transcriptional regulator
MPSIDAGAERLGRHVRTEAAYRRLVERNDIPAVVLPCRSSVLDGRAAAARLVEVAAEATAVVVGDEAVAAGLVAGLQRRGVRVPDDISVLGLLTSLESMFACNPPLTVVSTPASELGRLGVQALLRQLAGEAPTEPLLRAGVLVEGESTGPAPARRRKQRR